MPPQANDPRFAWTQFYEAIADKLLSFKDRRDVLMDGINAIASSITPSPPLQDKHADKTTSPLQDICPFTVFGLFNRNLTIVNRKALASKLSEFLGVTVPLPLSFEGIPTLSAHNAWFFGFEPKRKRDDIDNLWNVFVKAMAFADAQDTPQVTSEFVEAFDTALQQYNVAWNLTMGLYWCRPRSFVSLETLGRDYASKRLRLTIPTDGPKKCCSGQAYLHLLKKLNTRFQDTDAPVHSFPEFGLQAWLEKSIDPPPPPPDYTIDTILSDGCFLPREKLKTMLSRLRDKKNLILQGPPGTGKTWLARRMAFALMGERDESRLYAVQFHPNLSYEDFVRGWRPVGEGKLSLVDGPFMEMIEAAKRAPEKIHVVLIEEVNRGNPAQIFGEMLTLLEADKRKPDAALALSYRREPAERVYIPDNLHIIGSMNIADRSLALVDIALRRRFAFIDLEPAIGDAWRNWVREHNRIAESILIKIEARLDALNQAIAADPTLGPQCRVGHSFVTPASDKTINAPEQWFREIVETEIGPLLEEYWPSASGREKARQAREKLLEGF